VSARLALASLPALAATEAERERWTVDRDGVRGRALVVGAGHSVVWALRPGRAVHLRSHAMLAPRDRLDGEGAIVARVSALTGDGAERTLWRRRLAAGRRAGPPRHRVSCLIPADAVALSLGAVACEGGPRAPRAVLWLAPTIEDPGVAPLAASQRSAGAPLPAGARSLAGLAPLAGALAPWRRAGGGAVGGVRTLLRARYRRPRDPGRPMISVLMPVHDPPEPMLAEAIASVRGQTIADWELCIADDGSTQPRIRALLEREGARDARIRVVRRARAGGIAAATNAAMDLARGEYIALLDHDDTLAPEALEEVAVRIAGAPDLDMIYTDEDIVLDGRPVFVHAKPDWSPDTLRTNGYTCHLGVYRRSLVERIGRFRSEFDGSQDIDMILRLTERTDRVAHIPRVLYHWRAHGGSTPGGDAKPYAYVAARRAIAAHLQRAGLDAAVDFGPPGLYRVAHRVHPAATVDLVVATTDPAALEAAAASWAQQSHPTWRAVVVAPGALRGPVAEALARADLERGRFTVLASDDGPATAALLAAGAAVASAAHIVLMESPAAGLTRDWLRRLLGYASQPGVAVAGAAVLEPDGTVRHAGVALPEGIALRLLHGDRTSMNELFGFGTSVYNVSAVRGVLAIGRDAYRRLGGLDVRLGELALVHLCLRARSAGHRVVIVPDARLRATEPERAESDLEAIWLLREEWARLGGREPYYSPAFRPDRGDFALRHWPR